MLHPSALETSWLCTL